MNNNLKGQILLHRGLQTDAHKRARDQESSIREQIQVKKMFDNMIWTADKATASTRPYLIRRLLEVKNDECHFMDEMKQKEIAEEMNQKNVLIENKLGQYIAREHFKEESQIKRSAALRANDHQLAIFARQIRSRATGVLQRSQIIANEQSKQQREAEAKAQERKWLENFMVAVQEAECRERTTEFNKKKAFREAIDSQLNIAPAVRCRDFETEKKRCESIVSKELAEIKAEKNAAWQRKQELKASYIDMLALRRQERADQIQAEKDYEEKKLREQAALNAANDATNNARLKNVEKLAKKQEIAANQLLEIKESEKQSLDSRAAVASQEIGIGKAVLLSAQEADEIYKEPFLRVKMQLEYSQELGRIRAVREEQIQAEKDRIRKIDLEYLEQSKREEARLKHEDELRRRTGLEMGKCLRSQIGDKVAEAKLQHQLDLEADWKRDADLRERELELEGEKKKLLNEFEAWRSHLMLPDQPEVVDCANRIDQAQRTKDAHRSAWVTETHDSFGKWHPEKPYHPFIAKGP